MTVATELLISALGSEAKWIVQGSIGISRPIDSIVPATADLNLSKLDSSAIFIDQSVEPAVVAKMLSAPMVHVPPMLFSGWTPEMIEPLLPALAGTESAMIDPLLTLEQLRFELKRLLLPASDLALRQVTALQRSLSLSLTGTSPVRELMTKLQGLCNASVAIISASGRLREATDPIPLIPIYDQISSTKAQSQIIRTQGWHGAAVTIASTTEAGQTEGWLVLLNRRPDFPDSKAIAAAHISATLVETSAHIYAQTQIQEGAIRTAVLEQALQATPIVDDPELDGRLAAVGISYSDPLHVITVAVGNWSADKFYYTELRKTLDEIMTCLDRAEAQYLTSLRDDTITILVNLDYRDISKILNGCLEDNPLFLAGVGRDCSDLQDIPISNTDSWLAIRSLRSQRIADKVMSFNDFDVSTRLFSLAGLQSMEKWSQEYLAPIHDKDQLVEALTKYFSLSQNIAAAARELNVHQNSLRYRLSRAEELLKANLKDPASISSIFLALAARELTKVTDETVFVPRTSMPKEFQATSPATLSSYTVQSTVTGYDVNLTPGQVHGFEDGNTSIL